MSQYVYRANLSAAAFPLLPAQHGRTVIIPQYDNTFNRQVVSKEDQDRDVGIPQVYEMSNVMPLASGFQSIAYDKLPIAALEGFSFRNIKIVRNANEAVAYIACVEPVGGGPRDIVCYLDGDTFWGNTGFGAAEGQELSVAHINGVSYILIIGIGCYVFDFIGAMNAQPLSGLVETQLKGLVAANGYLIAWTDTEVLWSSTVDPTDFVPSLATGAGGGSIQQAKGKIINCAVTNVGFIVYTTNNAVVAVYSGNARYPFNFREITSSGGLTAPHLVAPDANSEVQYAYTTSGLQSLSNTLAKQVYPELSDFLAGNVTESINVDTGEVIRYTHTGPRKIAISLVADRYLVLSYNRNDLGDDFDTYHGAVIYDIAQKRFGKLAVWHVACFEAILVDDPVADRSRKSIAFLKIDGTIRTVNFELDPESSPLYESGGGYIVLGKYQHVRNKNICIDQVDVENAVDVGVKVFSCLDGKTVSANEVGYPLVDTGALHSSVFSENVGLNQSVMINGVFNLNSLVLHYHLEGDG